MTVTWDGQTVTWDGQTVTWSDTGPQPPAGPSQWTDWAEFTIDNDPDPEPPVPSAWTDWASFTIDEEPTDPQRALTDRLGLVDSGEAVTDREADRLGIRDVLEWFLGGDEPGPGPGPQPSEWSEWVVFTIDPQPDWVDHPPGSTSVRLRTGGYATVALRRERGTT